MDACHYDALFLMDICLPDIGILLQFIDMLV